MNTNRDIFMTIDVKTSKVSGGGFGFYVTDKNTSNFFVKLAINMSTNPLVTNYVSLEQASNYQLKLIAIKPDGEIKMTQGTLMNEENAIFQFNLSEDYKDVIGTYKCEFWIYSTVNGTEEIVTTDPFTYTVKPSILNDSDEPITDPQGKPIVLRFNNGNLEVTIDGVTKVFSPIG